MERRCFWLDARWKKAGNGLKLSKRCAVFDSRAAGGPPLPPTAGDLPASISARLRMSRELSDSEIDVLRRRIASAAGSQELDPREVEVLDDVALRLRRYGANLYLSSGDRERLHQIFSKTAVLDIK
jgi:hypothetical protein